MLRPIREGGEVKHLCCYLKSKKPSLFFYLKDYIIYITHLKQYCRLRKFKNIPLKMSEYQTLKKCRYCHLSVSISKLNIVYDFMF